MSMAAGTVAPNINIYEGLLLMVASIMMKKKLFLNKNLPNLWLECKN